MLWTSSVFWALWHPGPESLLGSQFEFRNSWKICILLSVSETANKPKNPQCQVWKFCPILSFVWLTKLSQKQCGRGTVGPEDLYLNHGPSLTGCAILDKLLKLSEAWFFHLKWDKHVHHIWWMGCNVLTYMERTVQWSARSFIYLKNVRGLRWWRSGWESACQCRGHRFEPWSGKIPHAAERLGPWATITEPARLEPVLRNKRGRDSERPAHRDEEWPPLAATRESPRTETKTQHSHK